MTAPDRPDAATIAAEILRRTAQRGEGKSICPSEVARALAEGDEAWRSLMGAVRAAAVVLAREGRVVILRKGKAADPDAELRGVIRLAVPPATRKDR